MGNLEMKINNLLNKLKLDEQSILFAKGNGINKKNLKSISKSNYVKDKVFFNFYNDFIKKTGKVEHLAKTNVVINTPFVQEKSVTQRGDMLHTIDRSMQLVHSNVADLQFFNKSAVAPEYCLVCVDLFTSKTYTYSMKKASYWLNLKSFIRQ